MKITVLSFDNDLAIEAQETLALPSIKMISKEPLPIGASI
jgi:hypothetical protein